ncbi:MAG TPA: amino acid adenylation domain-containing protein, partial [Polyangia bacterium]|nr:amino acid adenylation domain-containing protein [Polyangia bacterium]
REHGAGDQRLVAYYTGAKTWEVAELRAALGAGLPEYMVPTAYVKLDALPLTANGKVDRRALPAPEAGAFGSGAYEAPVGPVEEKVAEIWREVLRVERVGRNDNFFALGGHSLLAVTVAERMRRAGLASDVRALFTAPTLAALAAQAGTAPDEIAVPPNLIPAGAEAITPEMVTLVRLDQQAIDTIVAAVPGGAANVQDIYPLAPLQEGILFHHLMAEAGDAYVLSVILRFGTRGRMERFVTALDAVIARHDILRTAVVWRGVDDPVQVVLRRATFPLQVEDLDAGSAGAEQLRARHAGRAVRMEVDRAPLLRGYAAADGADGQWLLLIQAHHLAVDHATLQVLVQEVEAIESGRGASLPAPEPFRSFVARARLGVSRAEHEAFFEELLGDVDETTAPYGIADVQGDGSQIGEAQLTLPRELTAALRERARERGVSAAALLHLAWALVVAPLSGRTSVVFGTVMFGRMQGGASAQRSLGMFINTLPARIAVGPQSVTDAVAATHRLLAQLIRHEHAPLALAQGASAVPVGTPLFTSLLNVRHTEVVAAPRDGDGHVEGAREDAFEELWSEERSNYPVTLSVDDMGADVALTAQVSAPAEAERVCAMMEAALRGLLEALTSAPNTPVNAIDVLPVVERQQVLEAWNATARAYPRQTALGALFDEQAEKSPEALAVIDGDLEVSYGDLARRANRLARALMSTGVEPGERVALWLDRSATLVAAELGVVKAGAAYVPLDEVLPGARQAFMVRDSAARVIVTARDRVLPAELAALVTSGEVRRIDADDPAVEALDGRAPSATADGDSAAYVMYTSGSTGTPKGVVISHRSVSRLVLNNGYAAFGPGDRVAFAANPAFDASTLEVWAPLLNGGRLVVIGRALLLDPPALARALETAGVSVLWMTVGLFNQVHAALSGVIPRLRYLIVGGDALDVEVIRRVARDYRPQHLLNGYGPTETTTFALVHEIDEVPAGARSVPLGRPIGNTRVYVLDEGRRPAPVGVAGELYIGGDGVGLGYLNDQVRTSERFVTDPFAGDGRGRLYKTGDVGRWRPDGTIEFLGRNDFQVKVRGFRIELGEIEARLAAVRGVEQVVVIARQEEGADKRLVAYYVGDAEAAHLRASATDALPEYMVPAAYVRMDAFPLTRNGKVDRRALPAPGPESSRSGGYEAPQGPVEETLAEIWREVLQVERVGRHDNFFALGGHSLLAMTVAERIRRAGLTADVRALFTAADLADLASRVGGGAVVSVPPNLIPAGATAITPDMLTLVELEQAAIDRIVERVPGGAANVQDIYPLAPLQEGILFHHLLQREGDPYLLSVLLAFSSREVLQGFTAALQEVIDRHDVLRTAVMWDGLSEPVQVVLRSAPLRIEPAALRSTVAADGDLVERLKAEYDPRRIRVDVREAPLVRGYVAHDAARDRWLLVLLAHHLVIDHATLELLVKETELVERGRGHELPPPVAFRSFVAEARAGVTREQHEAHFRGLLGDVTQPTTPFGFTEAHGDGRAIDEARLTLDDDLSNAIRERAQTMRVSAASLVHLAWAAVVARAAGQRDVTFGTVLLGRMQGGAGVGQVLGMFINTLPVHIAVDSRDVAAALLGTHEQLAALLRHEHASLVLAQRCSGVPAGAPLFTSLLNYRHTRVGEPNGSSRPSSEDPDDIEELWGEERSNYPLTLSVDDLGRGFVLTAQVSAPVAAARVCAMMEAALRGVVEALERAPEMPVSAIDVLPAGERRQVVEGWNATTRPYPREASLGGLFDEHAERAPEAVAVIEGESELSYGELAARANRLARVLVAMGVGPGEQVAVSLERSTALVTAELAIVKAGGAYVPLDAVLPGARQALMVRDCGARTIVSARGRVLPDELEALVAAGEVRRLDVDDPALERFETDAPVVEADGGSAAYVMYTSGSTGKPKGVVIPHRAVSR